MHHPANTVQFMPRGAHGRTLGHAHIVPQALRTRPVPACAPRRWFAGNQIRNVSSLGGNIVTGSPISDLNPVWMASGATFTALGKVGGL